MELSKAPAWSASSLPLPLQPTLPSFNDEEDYMPIVYMSLVNILFIIMLICI